MKPSCSNCKYFFLINLITLKGFCTYPGKYKFTYFNYKCEKYKNKSTIV